MSIVTKTGDNGTTGLYGGQRLPKDDACMHAIGTVDELNAVLGLVLAEENLTQELRTGLISIQHQLFRLGGDLASPAPSPHAKSVGPEHVAFLDVLIGRTEPTLPQLHWFILPSGSRTGSLLHLARAVCRRAERWTVSMREHHHVHTSDLVYLNRLSDLLFLLARQANIATGLEETKVEY